MGRELREQSLELPRNISDWRRLRAGAHAFGVDHGRQSLGIAWHLGDEIPRLIDAALALREEMIGAARQPRACGAGPIHGEVGVAKTLAFRRLDVGKRYPVVRKPP